MQDWMLQLIHWRLLGYEKTSDLKSDTKESSNVQNMKSTVFKSNDTKYWEDTFILTNETPFSVCFLSLWISLENVFVSFLFFSFVFHPHFWCRLFVHSLWVYENSFRIWLKKWRIFSLIFAIAILPFVLGDNSLSFSLRVISSYLLSSKIFIFWNFVNKNKSVEIIIFSFNQHLQQNIHFSLSIKRRKTKEWKR